MAVDQVVVSNSNDEISIRVERIDILLSQQQATAQLISGNTGHYISRVDSVHT
jgi:hypothetical protein